MKIFRILLLSILIAYLGACAQKEKSLTVSDFLGDETIRLKTLTWCKDNPAERTGLSNCINADEAQYQIASGAYARAQRAAHGEKY